LQALLSEAVELAQQLAAAIDRLFLGYMLAQEPGWLMQPPRRPIWHR
jgi:hypothetical protein